MATSVYLSNPAIEINNVDLSDQCTAATVTYTVEALENTAFGSTARTYTSGLANNSITVTLYQSYASNETEASIYALVGTTTTLELSPTAAGLTTPTAASPKYTLNFSARREAEEMRSFSSGLKRQTSFIRPSKMSV